jgi:hypothetical protein
VINRQQRQLQERDGAASELEATLAISEQEKDPLHDVINRRGKQLQESTRYHKLIISRLRNINVE